VVNTCDAYLPALGAGPADGAEPVVNHLAESEESKGMGAGLCLGAAPLRHPGALS